MDENLKNKRSHYICISKTNIICFIMFVLLTFIDQLSKLAAFHYLREQSISLIPNVLELCYLENKGAAWGILQNQTGLLAAVTAIVLIVIAYALYRLPDTRHFRLLRVCLVLMSAGALGNFIDRIYHHYVIDFIYFSLIDFPVFNFADCLVCISAVMILYCLLFKYKDDDFLRHNFYRNEESDGTDNNDTGGRV